VLPPETVLNASIYGTVREMMTLTSNQTAELEKVAAAFASDQIRGWSAAHRRAFVSSINDAIGISLPEVLTETGVEAQLAIATRNNVQLIVDLTKSQYDAVYDTMAKSFSVGDSYESLSTSVKRIVDENYRNRSKVIARDQSSKLNGDLNRIRQQNASITKYIWRASDDERTRETHADNANLEFEWNNPPEETGHPGEDIQCRCWADPVLTDLRRELGLDEDY
jgi:SPP1 gp7 family putative phage head morphogenesis protein